MLRLYLLAGAIACLPLLFWAGVMWEKKQEAQREAQDRLETLQRMREIEDEVDTLDDDALIDGIVRP